MSRPFCLLVDLCAVWDYIISKRMNFFAKSYCAYPSVLIRNISVKFRRVLSVRVLNTGRRFFLKIAIFERYRYLQLLTYANAEARLVRDQGQGQATLRPKPRPQKFVFLRRSRVWDQSSRTPIPSPDRRDILHWTTGTV